MLEVISSNISHIGYDSDTKTLKVRFKKGGEYHYQQVEQKVYDEFVLAKSIGSFFAKNIKPANYAFYKVDSIVLSSTDAAMVQSVLQNPPDPTNELKELFANDKETQK